MSIEQIYKPSSLTPDSLPTIQKALEDIHAKAFGVQYNSAESPTISNIPIGKIVICDDGTTQSAYVRTGAGTLLRLAGSYEPSVAENTPIYYNYNITTNVGDTYWVYNSTTGYLEGWVSGTKRMEM